MNLTNSSSHEPKQESALSEDLRQLLYGFGKWMLVALACATVTSIVIAIRAPSLFPDWTGFGESVNDKALTVTETQKDTITKVTVTQKRDDAKTLWDWMSLLLVPASLALFAYWLQVRQEIEKRKEESDKAEKLAEEQAKKDRAEKQAQFEKEIANSNQREQALESYLDSMSGLLVDRNLSVLIRKVRQKSLIDNEQYRLEAGLDVIRARTLSILRRLNIERTDSNKQLVDEERKASVLLFLYDTELIKLNKRTDGEIDKTLFESLLNLSDADFSGANFSGAILSNAILSNANFSSANFSSANFSGAILHNTILEFANLSNANLSSAILIDSILLDANLSNANLNESNLSNSHLSDANLSNANLSGTDLSNACLNGANLSSVKLSNANLNNADLIDASLSNSYLYGVSLNNADLSNANLTDANLTGVRHWTEHQLSSAQLCRTALPEGCRLNPDRDCQALDA
jgi:uncharacterized protein YjbI with pentapeptide repeats